MVDGDNKLFIADMVKANLYFNTLRDNPAGLDLVGQWEQDIQGITFRDNTSGEVNWTIVRGREVCYVFSGGVFDNQSRSRIIDGWSFRLAIEQSAGFNAWAYQIAKQRLEPNLARREIGNRQVCFVGHSGGGCVVEAYYYQLFGRDIRPDDVWILTGTPRGLSFGYPGFYGACKITRFMNLGDPIPVLPPRMREWPEFCLIGSQITFPATVSNILESATHDLDQPVFQVWPGFHQPPGGIILTDSGTSYPRHEPIVNRADNPLTDRLTGGLLRLTGLPEHQMLTYVNNVEFWSLLHSPLEKMGSDEQAGESGGGSWAPEIGFFCPEDDFGRVVPSPQGRVQPMGNIVSTGPMPSDDGSPGAALYLRGQLVARFPNRGRARTAASKLNKFLAKLPTADEVSTGGLADGMLQYLNEAAIGGGVDRRPVRVVT